MSRTATIIGRRGGNWSSLSIGSASDIREEFKHGKFTGFEVVHYLDTSGGTRRKKGKPAPAKAKAAPKQK